MFRDRARKNRLVISRRESVSYNSTGTVPQAPDRTACTGQSKDCGWTVAQMAAAARPKTHVFFAGSC